MESKTIVSLRVELLKAFDQQIGMLVTKTFACFTNDERSEFKKRQQRIRELDRRKPKQRTQPPSTTSPRN